MKDKLVIHKQQKDIIKNYPLNASEEYKAQIRKNNDRIFKHNQNTKNSNYKYNKEKKVPEDKIKVKLIEKHDFILMYKSKEYINGKNKLYFIYNCTDILAALNKAYRLYPNVRNDLKLLSIKVNGIVYEIEKTWLINPLLKKVAYNEDNATYSGNFPCYDLNNLQNSILKHQKYLSDLVYKGGHIPETKEKKSFKSSKEKTILKHKRKNRRLRLKLVKKEKNNTLLAKSKANKEKIAWIWNPKEAKGNLVKNDTNFNTDFKICMKNDKTGEVVRIWNSQTYDHDSPYINYHPTSKSEWKEKNKISIINNPISKKNKHKIDISIKKALLYNKKVKLIQDSRAKREKEFDKQYEDFKKEYPTWTGAFRD
jgi:hypothetical protein